MIDLQFLRAEEAYMACLILLPFTSVCSILAMSRKHRNRRSQQYQAQNQRSETSKPAHRHDRGGVSETLHVCVTKRRGIHTVMQPLPVQRIRSVNSSGPRGNHNTAHDLAKQDGLRSSQHSGRTPTSRVQRVIEQIKPETQLSFSNSKAQLQGYLQQVFEAAVGLHDLMNAIDVPGRWSRDSTDAAMDEEFDKYDKDCMDWQSEGECRIVYVDDVVWKHVDQESEAAKRMKERRLDMGRSLLTPPLSC